MVSTTIDRLDGLSSSTAVKGPCLAATTASILLTGLKTIDGVALETGDRVLVKDQAAPTENGIWVVDTGPWRRARDFASTRDVVTGTRVYVVEGTLGGGAQYQVTTEAPVVFGQSQIQFEMSAYGNASAAAAIGAVFVAQMQAAADETQESIAGSAAEVVAASEEAIDDIVAELASAVGAIDTTEAAAVATLENYADALRGTSTTNITIGTGSKVFTTQAGKQWTLGQRLRAASDDATKIMEGEVTAYSGTSLTLLVDFIRGSGTHADWNISLAGARGQEGAGAFASGLLPSGRLSLASGAALTSNDVLSATTLYYTPCVGHTIPIWNGTEFVSTVFAEMTQALNPTSSHSGYHQSGKNFDAFVINDGGILRLGTGPAWTSNTARGTGAGTTELDLVSGVLVNKNSISIRYGGAGAAVTVAARMATFVGSIRATADGETEDSFRRRLVSNAYNTAIRPMRTAFGPASFVYSATGFAQVNADPIYQIDWLHCLPARTVKAEASAKVQSSTSTLREVLVGIAVNSATNDYALTHGRSLNIHVSNVKAECLYAEYEHFHGLGYYYAVWSVWGGGADIQTWSLGRHRLTARTVN